jgi:hypothetical protein
MDSENSIKGNCSARYTGQVANSAARMVKDYVDVATAAVFGDVLRLSNAGIVFAQR